MFSTAIYPCNKSQSEFKMISTYLAFILHIGAILAINHTNKSFIQINNSSLEQNNGVNILKILPINSTTPSVGSQWIRNDMNYTNTIIRHNNHRPFILSGSFLSRDNSSMKNLTYKTSDNKPDYIASSDNESRISSNETYSLSHPKAIEIVKSLNETRKELNSTGKLTKILEKRQQGQAFQVPQTNHQMSIGSQSPNTAPLPGKYTGTFVGINPLGYQSLPPNHFDIIHSFLPRPLAEDFEEYELFPLVYPPLVPFHDFYYHPQSQPQVLHKPLLISKGPVGTSNNQGMPEQVQLFQSLQVNDNPTVSSKSPLRIPSKRIQASNLMSHIRSDSQLAPFRNNEHRSSAQINNSNQNLHKLSPRFEQHHHQPGERIIHDRQPLILSPLRHKFDILKYAVDNYDNKQTINRFPYPTLFRERFPRYEQLRQFMPRPQKTRNKQNYNSLWPTIFG